MTGWKLALSSALSQCSRRQFEMTFGATWTIIESDTPHLGIQHVRICLLRLSYLTTFCAWGDNQLKTLTYRGTGQPVNLTVIEEMENVQRSDEDAFYNFLQFSCQGLVRSQFIKTYTCLQAQNRESTILHFVSKGKENKHGTFWVLNDVCCSTIRTWATWW